LYTPLGLHMMKKPVSFKKSEIWKHRSLPLIAGNSLQLWHVQRKSKDRIDPANRKHSIFNDFQFFYELSTEVDATILIITFLLHFRNFLSYALYCITENNRVQNSFSEHSIEAAMKRHFSLNKSSPILLILEDMFYWNWSWLRMLTQI